MNFITRRHFCICINTRKHRVFCCFSGNKRELLRAKVLLHTRDLGWKWWKNIIVASSTEEHLLAAIKANVLICQSLHANWISHPCPHLTSHQQQLRDWETFRDRVSAPLCDVVWIIKCILTCKSGLKQVFSWPPRRLGWAPEIPPLIWHDLIWRISVLLLLSDVWTHMWGVRLREVFPELLWELMWDNSGPCLEQKRGKRRGMGGGVMQGMWIQHVKAQSEAFDLPRSVSSASATSLFLSLSFSSPPKPPNYWCVGSPGVLTAVLGVL